MADRKPTTTRPRALREAKTAQERLSRDEERATDSARRRDRAVATAQGQGASYGEIREATGLSTSRLTQILRRTRQGA